MVPEINLTPQLEANLKSRFERNTSASTIVGCLIRKEKIMIM